MLVPLTILLLSNYILAYDGKSRLYYDLADAEEYFSWFMETYNKTYTKIEAVKRFEIFKEYLKQVNVDNSGLDSPVFGITQFADLTTEEFIQKHTGFKIDGMSDIVDRWPTYCNKNNTINVQMDIPENFDWRNKSGVTPVKDQGHCGSCWAFSATGNIESQYAVKHGSQIDLSEQQLVDCDDNCSGCKGGLPSLAWTYLIKAGGQENEVAYKYTGRDGQCRFDTSKVAVHLKGCTAYVLSEDDAMQLLVQSGPLSIAVDAEPMLQYTQGILKDCKYKRLNHAVLLVGYGVENGKKYWTIKNSWGTSYGEHGYIRVARGVNACGLLNYYFEVTQLAD